MKKSLFSFIILLSLLLQACGPHSGNDYGFNVKVYEPVYARGFSILGADSMESTIIRITNPWQGVDNVSMDYFISRNGEEPPAGFQGQVIKAGVQRIVCMSSSYVAMLDALGQTDRIVGVSGLNYITNEYIRNNSDKVKDVGAEINFETVAMQRPDLVMLYGIGDARTAETNKLRELSIPYIYIGEYLEPSPLGRAEWLVLISELTDSRGKGEDVFRPIPARYDSLKALVENIQDCPSVMLNTPWTDSWFMPPTDSYMPKLIDDAGGKYIYPLNTSNTSQPIGLETAYSLVAEADYWLNLSSLSSLDEVVRINPSFADVRVVREHKVYNNIKRMNGAGANDFWESSVVRPDIVLKDLINIFHPEILQDTLYYYKRLE